MPKLAVFQDRNFQYNHYIDKEVTVIGRSQEADVPLTSAEVSHKHMVILRRGYLYIAQDLASTNDTTINGRPVDFQHALSHGDKIEVARHVLVFHHRSAPQLGDGGLSRRDAPVLTRTDLEKQRDKTHNLKTDLAAAIKDKPTEALTTVQRDAMRAAIAARRKAHLAFIIDGERTDTELKDEVIFIGWSDDCAVRLPGTKMFTAHAARLEKREGVYHLVAMSRLHPVKMKGEKVTEARLKNEARFSIGSVPFRFRDKV